MTILITQHNKDLDTIESLIDRLSVPVVVSLLAEVCSAKADHLRENWQDEPGAKDWDRVAGSLLNEHARLVELCRVK
jgi:hypothetical protein